MKKSEKSCAEKERRGRIQSCALGQIEKIKAPGSTGLNRNVCNSLTHPLFTKQTDETHKVWCYEKHQQHPSPLSFSFFFLWHLLLKDLEWLHRRAADGEKERWKRESHVAEEKNGIFCLLHALVCLFSFSLALGVDFSLSYLKDLSADACLTPSFFSCFASSLISILLQRVPLYQLLHNDWIVCHQSCGEAAKEDQCQQAESPSPGRHIVRLQHHGNHSDKAAPAGVAPVRRVLQQLSGDWKAVHWRAAKLCYWDWNYGSRQIMLPWKVTLDFI